MLTMHKGPRKNHETIAKRALQRFQETAADAYEAVDDAAEDVESWARENLETIRVSVRERPLWSLTIAMSVGAVLSTVLLSKFSEFRTRH